MKRKTNTRQLTPLERDIINDLFGREIQFLDRAGGSRREIAHLQNLRDRLLAAKIAPTHPPHHATSRTPPPSEP